MNPKNEPVSFSGAITALAVATIPLLRAFSVSISEAQSDAILAFLAAAIALGTIVLRSQVTTKANAEEKITEAFQSTPGVDARPVL